MNKPTEEQEKFIKENGKESIILSATAGSGKTASCVSKLKYMLEQGVDPKKIIFFSFTKAAVEELKERIGNTDIDITTIHSFCFKVLSKSGRYKDVATIYDFLDWFKKKMSPPQNASKTEKDSFYAILSDMYEDANKISSDITAYKASKASNIPCKLPEHYNEYVMFLKETKKRDFFDMLLEVNKMFNMPIFLNQYKGKYDYIFIDEYQDTSPLQLEVLLKLNADKYFLIGDKNQSIFGFSGSNALLLDQMLSKKKKVIEMTLSINFRSDIDIVENANKYSDLKAVPFSEKKGSISKKVLTSISDLQSILRKDNEIAVLVRTNSIIKKIELELLKRKVKIKYFNYLSEDDMNKIKNDDINFILKNKIKDLIPIYGSAKKIVSFIEENKNINKFVTSIHKSKGKEFNECVIVNSICPIIASENELDKKINKRDLAKITFDLEDEEPRFVHYVAVTRARNKFYYMYYA